jgi:cation:H+ antiporter
MIFLFIQHKRGAYDATAELDELERPKELAVPVMCLLFLVGLGGIVLASEFIVASATTIALSFKIPTSVVAQVLVAFGTSIPEVATCITAARKGHGSLAVGNILGADIMNICWVAGASAIANDLTLGSKELFFMFPAMFVVVGTMLIALRMGYTLTKKKSAVIFGVYLLYLATTFILFPPAT